MTPLQQYEQDLEKKLIVADAQQRQAVMVLEKIFHEVNRQYNGKTKFFQIVDFFQNQYFNFRHPVRRSIEKKLPTGAYLFGSVGSGKTYLMDTFFGCLSLPKWRVHFYGFMKIIHQQLKSLEGKKNPLDIIAKNIRKTAKVLCFDEFFVLDIVDAMILGNVLSALFKQGICLLITSNVYPDELYKNGLQREMFLPAIQLLKKNLTIIGVNNHIDYRLHKRTHVEAYFYPLNEQSQRYMEMQFDYFSLGKIEKKTNIQIMDRQIPVVKMSDNIVWFDFAQICHVPRSQRDYLDIAEKYKIIFISGVRSILSVENNIIALFITLIDVLYDAKIKLFISAQVRVEDLYPEGELSFQFQRTKSRLIEMQSREYLGKYGK